ncbi:MAG TPA: cation diffusion facilitator family transporter [Acetobacteraceae bacterium]|nr:cation diffusion facilitator family transporter [Acetobacteraceae bacterium]
MHEHNHESSHESHGHAGHGHASQGHAGHGHHHGAASFGWAFPIGVALNAGFVVFEVVGGVLANSTALLADAGHNLGDVLGLLGAWVAAMLARRLPSARYTYGLRAGTILASLANAAILLISIGAILVEALRRLLMPVPVEADTVIVVALIGIAINGATALMFAAGRRGEINVRSVFQHMAADAVISAGVVLAAIVVALTRWNWIDPVASIAVALAIGWGTWSLFRESLGMMLGAVPSGIEPDSVKEYLLSVPGVVAIHDLHIWSMSTTETALTCHLVVPGDPHGPNFLADIARELSQRFDIDHPTLQIERHIDVHCLLAPANVV